VGALGQLGCWLTPVCQEWQAAKPCILNMVVMHPLADALPMKQTHGLEGSATWTLEDRVFYLHLCLSALFCHLRSLFLIVKC